MEAPIIEHSDDSESGDSWTLLEPSYGDDVPELSEIRESNIPTNPEKDEDTDGISIISDSEPDSPSLCQTNYEQSTLEENCSTENDIPKCVMENPLSNVNINQQSVREDDLLSNVKHKTYVHRRNKRLSTVLNIIVLGSVITAAGVAIGHMWGAKTDCSIHTTPTVNKILSNLYKLQEENAYLRGKLKELTALSSYQISIQKASSKPNKCKKIFEESLNNNNIYKPTKCLDDRIDKTDKALKSHLVQPAYEKEFLSNINKLKNVYLQNKSWLDDEIYQKVKQEEEYFKRFKNKHISKFDKTIEEYDINKKEKLITKDSVNDIQLKDDTTKDITFKKKSYADSLKTSKSEKKNIGENIQVPKAENKEKNKTKKIKGEYGPTFDYSISEEEFQKDNRYVGHKYKPEKKKQDRQKLHKKQKRKNKYEQWEMKGGFMKDYDETSFTSLQDNDILSKDKNIKNDANVIIQVKDNNFDKHFDRSDKSEVESEMTKRDKDYNKDNINEVESNWYEKRSIHRTEARKKLEHELFNDSPSTAGWYFRRMNKREQCRAKSGNSTYRKISKRQMNFKMKH